MMTPKKVHLEIYRKLLTMFSWMLFLIIAANAIWLLLLWQSQNYGANRVTGFLTVMASIICAVWMVLLAITDKKKRTQRQRDGSN